MLSLVLIIGIEWLIFHYRWEWLLTHPHSYGLQGCVGFLVVSLTLGAFCRRYRKGALYSTVLAVLLVGLQLLGGGDK